MSGLNIWYAGCFACLKRKIFCIAIMLIFLYKGNCKGSQKEDENVKSCTRVNAHSKGKAAFLLYVQ